MYFAQVVKEFLLNNDTYTVTYIHFVLVVAISCHLVDPLCILCGYDQFRSSEYRSTLYPCWLYLFINTIMDSQCILWQPYLADLDHPNIGMPALGLEHVIIFLGCLCAASVGFSEYIPLLGSLQSISVISSHLLTSYFGGQYVTHQHYSLWQVSQVSHVARKCHMLLISVASIKKIIVP
jgi:hypothetical protein